MAEKRKIEVRNEETEVEAKEPQAPEYIEETETPEESNAEETLEEGERDESGNLKARLEELEAENKKLSEEAAANYDRFVRVSADFDNFRKRSNKEMGELRRFANEKLLKELLSVVDNLERAIESGAKEDSSKNTILQGVEITLKDVFRTLENNGVKSFDSTGEAFDPVYHQAMMQQETDEYPDNTVINEMQRGYTLHDRLLRPAMVIVSKAASEKGQNDKN